MTTNSTAPDHRDNITARRLGQLPDGHHTIIPVCIRPRWSIAYEAWDRHVFVHLALHGITAEDADTLAADMTTLGGLLDRPLYHLTSPEDPSFVPVMLELGFRPAGEVMDGLGRVVPVLARTRDNIIAETWLPPDARPDAVN